MASGKRTIIERPEHYTDEEWRAYKAGAAAMASYLAQVTGSVAAAASSPDERAEEAERLAGASDEEQNAGAAPGNRSGGNESPKSANEKSSCQECGGEVRFEMGSDVGRCTGCGADVHYKTD